MAAANRIQEKRKNESLKNPKLISENKIRKLKFEVTKEELEKLVWEKPTTEVAKTFNVSDKAIEKRCKKFGIEKPSRGYWEKLKHNKL